MILTSTQDQPRAADPPAGDQALRSSPLSCSPLPSAFDPPPAPEENGETELEPMRNGAGHISETESSDSGATSGDKENSVGPGQDMEG